MGLVTKNYNIENLGLEIPEAYAIIKYISVNRKKCIAEFAVQQTREKALNSSPIQTEILEFDIVDEENPYTTAYTLAKEEGQPFHGWKDDIVAE
jgi:hypothetical protein